MNMNVNTWRRRVGLLAGTAAIGLSIAAATGGSSGATEMRDYAVALRGPAPVADGASVTALRDAAPADQRVFLRSSPLTSTDYLAAASAATACIESAVPGAKATKPEIVNGHAEWNVRVGVGTSSEATPDAFAAPQRDCWNRYLSVVDQVWVAENALVGQSWNEARDAFLSCLGTSASADVTAIEKALQNDVDSGRLGERCVDKNTAIAEYLSSV